MAITLTTLADGQMPSTITTAYTAPASTTAVILSAIFHNTDSGAHTIEMYLNTGTNRQLFEISLSANQSYMFTERVVIETSSSIRLNCDAGSVVDYVISGLEVT